MEVSAIVENIQRICAKKGITPTAAARESGAGKDLISNMRRKGTLPSVEKIRLIADYLGVTVSELLGETSAPAAPVTPIQEKFDRLSSADQEKAMAFIDWLLAQEQG